jgi:hypothetical protein
MPHQRVVPICKYEHGPLVRVNVVNKPTEWGLVYASVPPVNVVFNLEAFVCPTCGYVELFDSNPESTAAGSPELSELIDALATTKAAE